MLVVILAGGVAACGSASKADSQNVKLTLVAYSTPKEAYDALVPAFRKTTAGAGTTFETSFGASGDQSRAVAAGLEADVVGFSLEPDMTRLVSAKLVDPAWNQDAYHGMVTDSVVVLVVRKGNPKGITSWDDLIQPGVEVVTPNPFTSGGARWNIMAAYGAQLRAGKSPDEAADYLRALFANVQVQDKSAREALQTFTGGKGDVMLAYENEAITAQRNGADVDYVIPDATILIENPIAVVSESKHRDRAKAFVDYLRSDEAQRIFADQGYRPVVASVLAASSFPAPAQLFSIADLGGWPSVTKTFFDPTDGIVTKIENDRGVSTN
jgi:sulfate transport system substrate-binding protein